jgi:rod shape determining protein RodA
VVDRPGSGGVVAAVPIAWHLLHDYQKRRVMTFLNPASDALGAGWNISQAEDRHGLGRIRRQGLRAGHAEPAQLPARKETDFIFTCARRGIRLRRLRGAADAVRGGDRLWHPIAMASRSQFGRLLAMGITLNFFFYIMINAAMVMGLIPVVGIPMPLISYGGTAMLTVMFGFGLLMSVHVHRQVEIPRIPAGLTFSPSERRFGFLDGA